VFASLLSLVLAVAAPPVSAPASASAAVVDPLGVQVRVLGNGLTVMLSVNRERPEVFGAVVVRTGARNDPAGETGMAHYLEHMLFKGTRRLARC
jgi:predicted Zn-dependent peptidase